MPYPIATLAQIFVWKNDWNIDIDAKLSFRDYVGISGFLKDVEEALMKFN